MAEPISTSTAAVAVAAAAAVAVPSLTLLGYPLGIRPEILFAGCAGGFMGVALLNTVPAEPHPELPVWLTAAWTAARRIAAVAASSLTAGYVAPMLWRGAPVEQLLPIAFIVGAGAQGAVTAVLVKMGIQKLDTHTPPEKEKTP